MCPGLRVCSSRDAEGIKGNNEKMKKKSQAEMRKHEGLDEDALFAASELLDQEGEYLQAHWIYT